MKITTTEEVIDQIKEAFHQEEKPEPSDVTDDNIPDIPVISDTNAEEMQNNEPQFDVSENSSESKQKTTRNRIGSKERINQLTKLNYQERERNQFLLNEIERLKQEKQQALYQAQQKHEIAVINHEHALQFDLDSAARELEEAAAIGDYKKIADCNKKIAQRSAEIQALKIQKNIRPPIMEPDEEDIDTNDRFQPPLESSFVETPELPPEMEEFLDQNPWLDATPGNQNYNPRLASEFRELGDRLSEKLILEGRSEFTQNPKFLNYILDEFKHQKGIKPSNTSNLNTTSKRNFNMVAPVTRPNASNSFSTSPRENYSNEGLTPEEIEIALTTPGQKSDKQKIYDYFVAKKVLEEEDRQKRLRRGGR